MDSCIKAETSREKRLFSLVEADAEEAKCVKRRRRLPSVRTLGYNEQQQPPAAFQLDQTAPTTTTTTTTMKRSSRFRGVSRHRWTGRYEAHLWDKGSWNATQKKKGKQVYLGAYDEEEAAARAYDLAAIKYWGTSSTYTNFPVSDYDKEIEIMQNVTKEEYLASLRRRSSGFASGVSKYRGVARHHQNGRWEARIGRVFGNEYIYRDTYSTQEEAAQAYDIAAIEYRGIDAVTNFNLSTYLRWLRPGDHSTANSNNMNLNKKPEFSNPNSFAMIKNPAISQQHEEIIERKMPLISTCNKGSSSPTALGLLLRSSMFKELVEKTRTTSTAAGSTLAESANDEKPRACSNAEDDAIVFYTGKHDHEVAYAAKGKRSLRQPFWNAVQ